MACGIYQIKCCRNGSKYIGKSTNIRKRWQRHRSDLNQGIHDNYKLQADWNYYGDRAFQFKIIERCPAWRLDYREAVWIERRGDYNLLRPDPAKFRQGCSLPIGRLVWLLVWAIAGWFALHWVGVVAGAIGALLTSR